MAKDFGGLTLPYKAYEDLSGQKYRFICLQDNDQVKMPDAATDYPFGVLQNAPAIGETAEVRVDGTSKLVMNDAVSIGTKIKMEFVSTSDNGKGDAADTGGDHIRGVCMEASGAEDDVGTILLQSGMYSTS